MALKKQSAQVMLEYVVAVLVVMTAVIIGGPFLVNSIGARFKVAENNADDAFTEKVQMAAKEKCVCAQPSSDPATWPVSGACGENGCSKMQKSSRRDCSSGCEGLVTTQCFEDATCCENPINSGCGTIAEDSGLCATRDVVDLMAYLGQENRGTCPGQTCELGERAYTLNCGKKVQYFACVKDITCSPGNSKPTIDDEPVDPAPKVEQCISKWTPDPATVCNGWPFEQKDGCNHVQQAVGTKITPQCKAFLYE